MAMEQHVDLDLVAVDSVMQMYVCRLADPVLEVGPVVHTRHFQQEHLVVLVPEEQSALHPVVVVEPCFLQGGRYGKKGRGGGGGEEFEGDYEEDTEHTPSHHHRCGESSREFKRVQEREFKRESSREREVSKEVSRED
jgi:hypothetical protein